MLEGFAVVLDLQIETGFAGFGVDLGFEVFYGLYFCLVILLELCDFLLEFMEAGLCVFEVFSFVGVDIGSKQVIELVFAVNDSLFVAL